MLYRGREKALSEWKRRKKIKRPNRIDCIFYFTSPRTFKPSSCFICFTHRSRGGSGLGEAVVYVVSKRMFYSDPPAPTREITHLRTYAHDDIYVVYYNNMCSLLVPVHLVCELHNIQMINGFHIYSGLFSIVRGGGRTRSVLLLLPPSPYDQTTRNVYCRTAFPPFFVSINISQRFTPLSRALPLGTTRHSNALFSSEETIKKRKKDE